MDGRNARVMVLAYCVRPPDLSSPPSSVAVPMRRWPRRHAPGRCRDERVLMAPRRRGRDDVRKVLATLLDRRGRSFGRRVARRGHSPAFGGRSSDWLVEWMTPLVGASSLVGGGAGLERPGH